jgi:hypothetical protein
MRYLKIFESSEIDIQLIKDIIVEIRDEYQSITGMIHEHQEYVEIELHTNKIPFKGKPQWKRIVPSPGLTLDYIEDTNKFISLITSVSRRLEDALNREVRIHDLYNFDGSVKILISKKSK